MIRTLRVKLPPEFLMLVVLAFGCATPAEIEMMNKKLESVEDKKE